MGTTKRAFGLSGVLGGGKRQFRRNIAELELDVKPCEENFTFPHNDRITDFVRVPKTRGFWDSCHQLKQRGIGLPWKKRLPSTLACCAIFVTLAACSQGDPAIERTASEFLRAEASADCPALKHLTAPEVVDPCADLNGRAYRLSMMEQTGGWKIRQSGVNATAKIELAGNVEIQYRLKQIDQVWYVIPEK